ncbi:hypothetical protein SCUCBS95973_003649 [Sporothrix curviconia]|uniref:Uncharacterized protein n=1 Tax=Sporothrix curviconia TaxID=1260050 RepID=A0ABP0BH70_9PEZI
MAMYAEAPSSPSWFDKLASCCGPPSPRLPQQGRNKLLRRGEKDSAAAAAIWSDEPALTPPPSFGPHPRPVDLSRANTTASRTAADARRTQWPSQQQSSPGQTANKSIKTSRDGPRSRHGYSRSGSSTLMGPGTGPRPSAGSRSSHSLRRRMQTSSSSFSRFPLPASLSASSHSSRRPQISAPTNFRHLESGTFVFPALPQEEQQQIQQYQREQFHQMSQQEKQEQQQQQQEQHETAFREQQQAFQQQYLQHYQEQYRQQYQQQFQRRPPSFQPLDFTTHLPSPLYASFQRATVYYNEGQDGEGNDNNGNNNDDSYDDSGDAITMPPRAHTRASSRGINDDGNDDDDDDDDDDDLNIDRNIVSHDRSHSTMSFHLPRRPVGAGSIRAGSVNSNHRTETRNNEGSSVPPAIPQRSRLRSHSSPVVESMVERIASAMIEMEKLQAEIDSVVERQSIYINSRPSTAYGMVAGEDLPPPLMAFPASFEEVPTVPAIPATAPSFAERLSTERPKTAPPRSSFYGGPAFSGGEAPLQPLQQPLQQQQQQQQPSASLGSLATAGKSTVSLASAASVASAAAKAAKAKAKASASARNMNNITSMNNSASSLARTGNRHGDGPRINGRPVDVPLAPPLPLVLRPPLRKKKSFSRVSHWLSFDNNNGHENNGVAPSRGGGGDAGGLSFDSVTNMPRPVTVKDGFYTCLSPLESVPSPLEAASGNGRRTSIDSLMSVDTLSTWTTEAAERRQAVMDEADYDTVEVDADGMPKRDTPTPTSATTMATLATLLTTAASTPTIPALAGMPSTAAANKMGESLLSHRPQSVGVAF